MRRLLHAGIEQKAVLFGKDPSLKKELFWRKFKTIS
jgi:hypothetical protein